MAVEITGFSGDKVIVARIDVTPEQNGYYLATSENVLYQYVGSTFDTITGIIDITDFSDNDTKVIVNGVETVPVEGTTYHNITTDKYYLYNDSAFSELSVISVDVVNGTVAYNENVEMDPIEGETYTNISDNKSYTYTDGQFVLIVPTYTITAVSNDLTAVTVNGEYKAVENDAIYIYPSVGLKYVGVSGKLSVTEYIPLSVNVDSVDIRNNKYLTRSAIPYTEILGYEDTGNGIKLIVEQEIGGVTQEVRINPVEGTLYYDIRSDIYYKYEDGELRETFDIEETEEHNAVLGTKYIVNDDYDTSNIFVSNVSTANQTIKFAANTDIPLLIFAKGAGTRTTILTISEIEHYMISYNPDDETAELSVYKIPYIDYPVDSINVDNNTVTINGTSEEAVDFSTYIDLDGITYYYEYGRFSLVDIRERVKDVPTSFDKVILEDDTEKAPVLGVKYETDSGRFVFVSRIVDRNEAFVKDVYVDPDEEALYIDTSNKFVYSYNGYDYERYMEYDDKFNMISYSYDENTNELTIMIPTKISDWHLPVFGGNKANLSDKVVLGYNEYYEANTITIKEDQISANNGGVDVITYM